MEVEQLHVFIVDWVPVLRFTQLSRMDHEGF